MSSRLHVRLSPQSNTLLLIVVPILVALVIAGFHMRGVHAYQAIHWLFNYDDGFVKRGLVGSIYQVFEFPVTVNGLQWVSYSMAVLAIVLICAFSTWVLCRSGFLEKQGLLWSLLLSVWIVTLPGLAQQFFFDLARFDVIGAMLLLTGVWMIVCSRSKRLTFWISALVSAIAILVHETTVVWVFPVLVASWWLKHGATRRDAVHTFVLSFGVFFFSVFVFYSGYDKIHDLETMSEILLKRCNFDIYEYGLISQYTGLKGNVLNAKDYPWPDDAWVRIGLGLIVLSVSVIVMLGVVTVRRMPRRWAWMAILGLCSLSPLVLMIMALDNGRWLSMSQFGTTLLTLVLLSGAGADIPILRRRWMLAVAGGIVFNLLLGPYGIIAPFPESFFFPYPDAYLFGP